VVDEGDAFTLVLEGWVGKGAPAAVLALIYVGQPVRWRRKSYGQRTGSNGYSVNYQISGRVDH